MDVLINDISLNGQFTTVDDFLVSTKVIVQILEEIKHVNSKSVSEDKYIRLFKKTDFNQVSITPTIKFYDLLTSHESRLNPQILKFKSILANLQIEPYWDTQCQQDSTKLYIWDRGYENQENISNSCLAEAYARNASLISFVPSEFNFSPIVVREGQHTMDIPNFFKELQLLEYCHDTDIISHADYIKLIYHTKLNFDNIFLTNGFDLINSRNINEFLDAFRLFEEKDWQDIFVDGALDYKEYHKNRRTKRYFPDEIWSKGIYKFRITRRYRAFGYQENNIFYVLRFDLDHELSDNG